MAKKLVQCKDCGKEVSKSAKTCHHCGAKDQYEDTEGWGCMVVIVLLFVLYFVFGGFGEDAEGQEAKMKAGSHSRVMENLP